MEAELLNNIREARRFVLSTMKKVRDEHLEVQKANAVNKGAREMVQLGKLEMDLVSLDKGLSTKK